MPPWPADHRIHLRHHHQGLQTLQGEGFPEESPRDCGERRKGNPEGIYCSQQPHFKSSRTHKSPPPQPGEFHPAEEAQRAVPVPSIPNCRIPGNIEGIAGIERGWWEITSTERFGAVWISQTLNSISAPGSHPSFRPWTCPGALYFIGNFLVSAAWDFWDPWCLMNAGKGRDLSVVRRRKKYC